MVNSQVRSALSPRNPPRLWNARTNVSWTISSTPRRIPRLATYLATASACRSTSRVAARWSPACQAATRSRSETSDVSSRRAIAACCAGFDGSCHGVLTTGGSGGNRQLLPRGRGVPYLLPVRTHLEASLCDTTPYSCRSRQACWPAPLDLRLALRLRPRRRSCNHQRPPPIPRVPLRWGREGSRCQTRTHSPARIARSRGERPSFETPH